MSNDKIIIEGEMVEDDAYDYVGEHFAFISVGRKTIANLIGENWTPKPSIHPNYIGDSYGHVRITIERLESE